MIKILIIAYLYMGIAEINIDCSETLVSRRRFYVSNPNIKLFLFMAFCWPIKYLPLYVGSTKSVIPMAIFRYLIMILVFNLIPIGFLLYFYPVYAIFTLKSYLNKNI